MVVRKRRTIFHFMERTSSIKYIFFLFTIYKKDIVKCCGREFFPPAKSFLGFSKNE